jgi:hypothetical protein
MNRHNLFVWIRNTAAVLATGALVVSSSAKGSDVPDSEQVSELLSEAKTLSFQSKEDAATMESHTRANHSWQSHAAATTQIKGHVNAL